MIKWGKGLEKQLSEINYELARINVNMSEDIARLKRDIFELKNPPIPIGAKVRCTVYYPEESQCVIGHVIGCNMEKAEYRYAGKSQYYWSYEVVDDEYKVHRVNSYFNDVTKLEDKTEEGIESGEGFSAEDQAQDDNEGKAERKAIQAKVEAQKVEVMKGVWVETRTDNL